MTKIFVDLSLCIFSIPVYAVLVLYLAIVGRNSKKQKAAIFCGLEHVIQKTIFRAIDLQSRGFSVKYYSFEITNNSLTEVKSGIVRISPFLSIDVYYFFRLMTSLNPIYIELYFEGSGLRQIFYSLISRINGSIITSIFRGGELYYFQYGKRKMKTYLCFISAHLSHKVFYREIYMKQYFKKFLINDKKCFFDYNRVPIFKDSNCRIEKETTVLYLNSIKSWRRIDILIEAFSIVSKLHSDVLLLIVGCRNENEFLSTLNIITKHKVEDLVILEYWTSDPHKYFESASIFVLPADLVFCNYSLLQSMERGIPAIVADVADADKIIKHGINGYLAKQTPEDFAKYISILLSDEELRIKMGTEARKTIIEHFNDKDRMIPIYELIKSRFPSVL